MKHILAGAAVFCAVTTSAQDSTEKKPSPFSFSGYLEVYYAYDFNKPAGHDRPAFFYSHNRHNEVNLNLGYLKVNYQTEKLRANLAIGLGTYMNANYAAEPGTLKNVYEANVGVKMARHKNLWLDAGIFPSHIGFESANAATCWTLTRSILADNSPYFESGAKLTYTTDNGKWLFSVLALNGWQRIQRVPGNSLLSGGTQIQYMPSSRWLINYSNFAGTDKPDTARLWRYYHNLYSTISVGEQVGITLGLDIGQEQQSVKSSHLNTWFSPVAIVRYAPAEKWAMALRGEYYNDKKGVLIATGTPNGFQTFGGSVNLDHAVTKNLLWRVEYRSLRSKDGIFAKGAGAVRNNAFLTTSLSLQFP